MIADDAPRRHLAVLLSSLAGGGVGRSMLRLGGALASRGVSVDILLVDKRGPYLDEVPESVRLVDLRAGRVRKAIPKVVRQLRRSRPDAVLSAITHLNVATIIAARLARIDGRVVVSERTTTLNQTGHSDLAIDRLIARAVPFVYRRADAVVCVSGGVADHLEAMGVDRGKLHVIHNPALVDDIQKRAEQAVEHPWLRDGGPPLIVSAGRLATQKDFPTLVTAFAKLRRSRDVRLIILGEGPERPTITQRAADLGLTEQDMQMPGFVRNPYPYMKAAQAFALSSVFEGFGNVLVEALALGTPVVATDCESGPAEILDHGRYGRLVPVGDVNALADAMNDAIDDTTRPGTDQWLARFSLKTAAAAYGDVLFGPAGNAG